MRLIIDANILFAALIRRGPVAELAFEETLELHAPAYLREELERNIHSIRLKTNYVDLEATQTALLQRITFHTGEELAPYDDAAQAISPDPKDTPYFALALALGCSFWTAERGLERQTAVVVVRTADLLRQLKKA